MKIGENDVETDRDVLFANEAFVIGMLQAVSGSRVEGYPHASR